MKIGVMKLNELKQLPTLSTITQTTSQPKLADMMKVADSVPTPMRDLTYYKPLLHKLYGEKEMIAKDIAVWLKAKGCGEYSVGQIYRMLRK